MQEQQLRARQLVLQQQAASAVAAASKTQREVGAADVALGNRAYLFSSALLGTAVSFVSCSLSLSSDFYTTIIP